MRFYLAGLYTSNFHRGGALYNFLTERERNARDSITNYLESYHYIGKGPAVDRIRGEGVRIFLDSGAFSSMSKGAVVDLERYVRFIRENEDILVPEHDSRGNIILTASVLDVVGDATATWQNQRRMEDLGVTALPCFHYGEPEEALMYYLENYDYITLGGMVPISTAQLIVWLNRLWGCFLTKPDGTPRVKVHGFGLTSLTLVERYPWYSIDSSTWVQASFNGGIMLPHLGVLAVAANWGHRSLYIKDAGKHFDTLTPDEQRAVLDVVEGQGFSMDRLRMHYQARWAYNCWAYKTRLDPLHENPRFVHAQPELF